MILHKITFQLKLDHKLHNCPKLSSIYLIEKKIDITCQKTQELTVTNPEIKASKTLWSPRTKKGQRHWGGQQLLTKKPQKNSIVEPPSSEADSKEI